jgi:hypothetical protein
MSSKLVRETAPQSRRVTALDLKKPLAFSALESELNETRNAGNYVEAAALQERLLKLKLHEDAKHLQVRELAPCLDGRRSILQMPSEARGTPPHTHKKHRPASHLPPPTLTVPL